MTYSEIKRELTELTTAAAAKLKDLTKRDQSPPQDRLAKIDAALNPILPKLAFIAYDPASREFDLLLHRCLATLYSSCDTGVSALGVYARLQLLFSVGTPMAALLQLDRIASLLLEPKLFVDDDDTTLGSHLDLNDITADGEQQVVLLNRIKDRVIAVLSKVCLPEAFEKAFFVFETLHQIVNAKTITRGASDHVAMLLWSHKDPYLKRFVSEMFAPGGKRSADLTELFEFYLKVWPMVAASADLPLPLKTPTK